jgi:tight adherence protein B
VKWLLLAACLLLLLTALGIILLLKLQGDQKALQQRLASVSAKPRTRTAGPSLLVRPNEKAKRSPAEKMARVIGYDAARRDQYRLPWFAVAGVALLTGRLVVMMAAGLVGKWAWIAFPIVTIFGSRAYYGWADEKRRTLLLNQFPDALSLIVRAVRVGIPVTESLRAVSREALEPTRTEFDRLQHQIAIGTPLETALRGMADRNGLPEYGFFAAALSLQAQTGGGLTETLETLAEIIRKRLAMKERGHALSSEARTSAAVLGVLPIGTAGLLYAVSPGYIGMLFTEPSGHMLIGLAVLMLSMGMGVMRMIIRKSLS